jgi:hypothetical protein
VSPVIIILLCISGPGISVQDVPEVVDMKTLKN